jgi:hypothetical protein
MKNGAVLLVRATVAVACVLAVCLCPSPAGVRAGPLTLGKLRSLDLQAVPKFKGSDLKQLLVGDKKPDAEKKPGDKKPPLMGVIKALADDGKSFTLRPVATKKNETPDLIEIKLARGTKFTTGKAPAKLAVGEFVSVWLDESARFPLAVTVQVGKPSADKAPIVGTIKKLADDGKSFTLQPAPNKKNEQPDPIEVRIGDNTKLVTGKEGAKLTAGLVVSVWLEDGNKVAASVQVGKPSDKPGKKPTVNSDNKPNKPRRVRAQARPARDPAPVAAVIDDEVDKQLKKLAIPASPQADDAEFLRRVTLDLTGRIPTYQRAVAFLDSKEPDKRRKLIDELLDSQEYAEHFATVWKNLIVPRDNLALLKGRGDEAIASWLAVQFDDNRGWDAIVTDLLTAEGSPRDVPAAAFVMAHSENGQPHANKVAAAATRLFLGVNVACAECHNHPFAKWKQSDFWGTAAFFGKVRASAVNGPPSLTDTPADQTTKDKKFGQAAFVVRGTAIVVPDGAGKSSGQAVKARFLAGDEATLDEGKPFRPRFAAWATGKDNPYFAQAAVNRLWAHFLGRGFVNPLDGFDDNNPPSHPALLRKLAAEFVSSGFDLKHLARCIVTSKTYQRTSRPVKGNEDDEGNFSKAAVKVLTPEAFFDSVTVIMKGSAGKQDSREQFVRACHAQESVTEYAQGIPHLLRLMNGTLLNRGGTVADSLVKTKASHAEAVTTLYLTALSRRPTADEVKLMDGYLSRRKSDLEGYRGVLWILMNSSEFALNR